MSLRPPNNVEFTVKAAEDLILEGSERSIVRVPQNNLYACLMVRTQRFSSLFRHYSKHHGLRRDSLVYYFTDQIDADDTPESIHLQKNDVIIVKLNTATVNPRPSVILPSIDEAYFTNMRSLLESGEHSDVTFLVGPSQEAVTAHKAMLSAGCEFFRGMFRQGGLRESKDGVVRVGDFSTSAVRKVLEFIYTNRVTSLEQSTPSELIEVISLSEQYLLPDLKRLCEESSKNQLSPESVGEFLSASAQYSASVLNAHCLQYILSNVKEVAESEKFQQQVEAHPQVTTMILKAAAPVLSSPPTKRRRIEYAMDDTVVSEDSL